MSSETTLTNARTNLSLVAVGDITDRFLVPAYQRGYRWTEDEVRVLLDDLSGIVDKDYCLQPVVVKKLSTGEYELIDGQQRMTTLYLVFLYLKKAGLKKPEPPFAIKYATRPESEKFLGDLDVSRATENIDFFHLASAYKCIEQWFNRLGPNKEQTLADDIFGHLHKRAKVIWYETPSDVAPAALFARLNVGRIPLTNAELVKALILGKSGTVVDDDHDDRQFELGTQWDIIERELHDPRFWSFLTNRDPDQYPTRIQLLFELLADTSTTTDRFHTFHHFRKQLATRKPEAVWRDVVARHDLLKDWYEDRDLYHFIGFLIATGSHDELRHLIRDAEGVTKTAFREGLTAKIRRRLDLSHDALADLDYETTREKASRALLLFNVESARLLKNSFDRYPFHSHKAKAGRGWSLEHIHAQNAEKLVTKQQWQAWLREHAKVLAVLNVPEAEHDNKERLLENIHTVIDDVTKETFDVLSLDIIRLFSSADATDDLHGIDNLALLKSDANSALGNAAFEVKRQRILEMDRGGEYLPICTRRVFLKYYTDTGDQQLQFWSKQDRAAYLGAIKQVLAPYLEGSPEASGAS